MSVAWVGAGIAAVGTVGGMVAGNKAQNAADAAAANQAAIQQQQQDIANEQWSTYKDTYQPLEKQMVADSQNYDSQEQQDKAASTAQATTQQQIALAQDRLRRTPGLDPTSGAAQAAQTKMALSGAALGATNQNQARTNVQNMAWARKMDALGLGKGLVTGASTGLAAAGQSASNMAATQQANATQTAASTASMITGLGNMGVKAYNAWNTPAQGVSIPESSLSYGQALPTANTNPIPGL
jgi:hypothetical protein